MRLGLRLERAWAVGREGSAEGSLEGSLGTDRTAGERTGTLPGMKNDGSEDVLGF